MRAFASSFRAWRSIERQEGIKVPHGLVYSLAVVGALGKSHGLELVAEETASEPARNFDAIFISVLDSRCMIEAAKCFREWGIPFRRVDRTVGKWPLVWIGGQGVHNPRPLGPVGDLFVLGDAEEPLPALLAAWERHGNSDAFLVAASTIAGVWVPKHHDPREVSIAQSVASDISVSLREDISVSHDGTRRVEIARGCKYKCTFCSLGWRTPVRENAPEQIIGEIKRSPRRVHLQAGDAESHSGIDVIRRELRAHGGMDQGWTGRLDSLFENPDQTIPGQKRYAFGVEGVSWRLRAAVGKGYLTDERLVADTCRFFETIEGDSVGRAAWHVITGLPTERPDERIELLRVIGEINQRREGKTKRNLSVHVQPFQPLPGTPMQWCAAGGGARVLPRKLGFMGAASAWVPLRWVTGRSDEMAAVCTSLSRADERGADLLEAIARGQVAPEEAAALSGATAGHLDPDAPLPWDFVGQHYPKDTLRRAYDAMVRRLSQPTA